MLANFFTDRSSELAGGGNVLYTPNMTEMAASAKTNATAVTLVAPTDSRITLAVDQWFECSFAIEDREAAQVKHSYYVQEKYAQGAGYSIAKKLEVALARLLGSFSGTAGSSTAQVADSDILSAIAQLESNGVDTAGGDVAFFFSPNVFWRQLQAINKFSLAINSPINDPVAKRPAAFLYGIPVHVTPNIQNVSNTVGRYNALAHKDALHWATSPLGEGGSMASSSGSMMTGQYGVRIQSHYVPEYLSTVTTADLLYGTIENRDLAGITILSAA